MNRHLPKTFVISIVSFGLLYYSTVWAVLRCLHEEGHSAFAVAPADTDTDGNNARQRAPSQPETDIDCLRLAYHTESLAGPSSPEIQRGASHINSRLPGFLTSPTVTQNWARDLWLRFVFEKPPGLTFLLDSPLYLLFSILRI